MLQYYYVLVISHYTICLCYLDKDGRWLAVIFVSDKDGRWLAGSISYH